MEKAGIEYEEDSKIMDRAFLKEGTDEINTNIERPPAPKINPKVDNLVFMQLDLDYETSTPPSHLNMGSENTSVVRIFGVTNEGNSVMAHVYCFRPYFYVKPYNDDAQFSASDLDQIKDTLNEKLGGDHINAITDIEQVEKKSIKNYSPDTSTFLKIYTRFPTDVSKIKSLFEIGFTYQDYRFDTITYESNMPYGLRFMIDTGIFGVSWIELKAGTYHLRKHKKTSSCQYEVDIQNYNEIECHSCEGPYAGIAPLRIMSFDIECASDKGSFPRAEKDPVIQIANICKIQGQEQPFIRNIFVLGD